MTRCGYQGTSEADDGLISIRNAGRFPQRGADIGGRCGHQKQLACKWGHGGEYAGLNVGHGNSLPASNQARFGRCGASFPNVPLPQYNCTLDLLPGPWAVPEPVRRAAM